MTPDIEHLRDPLMRIAEEELMLRYGSVSARAKADGTVVTEADLAAQRRTKAFIDSAFPGYGFLSEEMSGEERQRQWARAQTGVWVLDPLDGTSNFASGIPFFAISLAQHPTIKP